MSGTIAVIGREHWAVRHAAHRGNTRYAMNGVLLDKRGITATNGKMLAHATWGTNDCSGMADTVLSLPTVAAARKAMSSRKGARAWWDGESLTAIAPPVTRGKAIREEARTAVPVATVYGLYPPYRDVLPDTTSGYHEYVTLDLGELEWLADIGSAAGDGMRLRYGAEGIASAEMRVPERGTVSIETCMAPRGAEAEETIGLASDQMQRVCRVLREWTSGSGPIRMWLPQGEGADRHARRGVVWDSVTARGDLTAILMPLHLWD